MDNKECWISCRILLNMLMPGEHVPDGPSFKGLPCSTVAQQLPPVVICCQHRWTAHHNQQRLGPCDGNIEPLWVSEEANIRCPTATRVAAVAAGGLASLMVSLRHEIICCNRRRYLRWCWWQAFRLGERSAYKDDAFFLPLVVIYCAHSDGPQPPLS